MNSLPKNLSANVFNVTFNVLNPYPENRKTVHTSLSALPLIPLVISLFFFILLWKAVECGLLLSLVIIIVCLNLILTDIASETYQCAEIFIKAIQRKADLGVGDIKTFQILKNALPRLSNYYLALSILFLGFTVTLDRIWYSLLWFFSQVTDLIIPKISATTGIVAYQAVVLLFALTIIIIQFFVLKIKKKFMSYVIELPLPRD